MGTSIAQFVISAICVSIAWVLSYFWNRRRMSKKLRLNRTIFLGHMAVLLMFVLVYQVRLLRRLDIYSTALVLTTALMAVATVLHNFSVLFQHKEEKHNFIRRIHGPISHMMFALPFSINMSAIGQALLKNASGSQEVTWSFVFMGITLFESVVGAYIGLSMMKQPSELAL